jgi:hypothetical protein
MTTEILLAARAALMSMQGYRDDCIGKLAGAVQFDSQISGLRAALWHHQNTCEGLPQGWTQWSEQNGLPMSLNEEMRRAARPGVSFAPRCEAEAGQ